MKRIYARFYKVSTAQNGSGDYSVLLTVKEFAPGQYRVDEENPVRLYHHRVEKNMTLTSSTAAPVEQGGTSTSSNVNSYTIRELTTGVNKERTALGKGAV
ncbi:MAG: hypothetical protein LBR31_07195 [Desulfovibrio sp.]|nr:hypothetical protein [Desulfovibrio sp.]